jgi:hypothetical protein
MSGRSRTRVQLPSKETVSGAGGGSGNVTVMVTDALFPSMVAVRVVIPPASAVATPLLSMVATEGREDVQVTGRPLSTFPALSRGVAVTVTVCSGATVTAVAVSVMVATGAGGGAAELVPAVQAPRTAQKTGVKRIFKSLNRLGDRLALDGALRSRW